MSDDPQSRRRRRQASAGEGAEAESARVKRWIALLQALRQAGPIPRNQLLEQLGSAYPAGDSGRRVLARDIRNLGELGITIKVSSDRPPICVLVGPVPLFDEAQLRALAVIRDSFDGRKTQHQRLHALLARLTRQLTDEQRLLYQQRQVDRALPDPAIDYTPYLKLISRLEAAAAARQEVQFTVRGSGGGKPHAQTVEPLEIVTRGGHLVLVAYSNQDDQIVELRVDQIVLDGRFRELERLAGREPIAFRYRVAAALGEDGLSGRFENLRVIETLPNGDLLVEAEGWSEGLIFQTLLTFGPEVELLSPPALRAQMAARVAALRERHGEGRL